MPHENTSTSSANNLQQTSARFLILYSLLTDYAYAKRAYSCEASGIFGWISDCGCSNRVLWRPGQTWSSYWRWFSWIVGGFRRCPCYVHVIVLVRVFSDVLGTRVAITGRLFVCKTNNFVFRILRNVDILVVYFYTRAPNKIGQSSLQIISKFRKIWKKHLLAGNP